MNMFGRPSVHNLDYVGALLSLKWPINGSKWLKYDLYVIHIMDMSARQNLVSLKTFKYLASLEVKLYKT